MKELYDSSNSLRGAIVTVVENKGRRSRIDSPVKGWISNTTSLATVALVPLEVNATEKYFMKYNNQARRLDLKTHPQSSC